MLKGMIIELSYQKGYGFVKEAETGKILRFDLQDLQEDLQILQWIEFSVIDLDPGKQATNIRLFPWKNMSGTY
jgi:cold shock CspA family protein